VSRVRALMPSGAPLTPLVVLSVLFGLDELDKVAFALLIPEIQDDLGFSLTAITAAAAVASLVAILLALPIGFYADRMRRTRIAAGGAVVWAGFSALTGLATGLLSLGVARAGSGLGQGVNDPVHRGLLSDYYPLSDRPKAFAVHGGARRLGQLLGFLLAGGLAAWLGWRAPFLLFAIPSVLVALYAFRLKEPVRGGLDRADAGAAEHLVAKEEPPATWEESWALLKGVRTLRRLWRATPYVVGGLFLLPFAFTIYLEEVFEQGTAARGAILAFGEIPSLIGLLIGLPIATRLLRTAPEKMFTLLGAIALLDAALIALLAVAPSLPVALLLVYTISLTISIVGPGVVTVVSMVTSPRARSFAFAVDTLYALPGLLIGLIAIGRIADTQGARAVMPYLAVTLAIGGVLFLTAKADVRADLASMQSQAAAAAAAREASEKGLSTLLVCRGVEAAYDRVQVLFGIDLEVHEGEVVALLGTNGAGKSTLLRAITGSLQPTSGGVVFDGQDVTRLSPAAKARLGIVQMPGGKAVFPTLTVAENLRTACWLWRRDDVAARERIDEALAVFPVLRERWDTVAGELSGGEQQMVGLAQALISRARLLLIDELSLGLAPAVVAQLLDVVRQINGQGTTVVIVEQSVNVALTVAGRAVFLEKGEVRYDGPTAELLERPDVMRSVFLAGTSSSARARARDRDLPGEPDAAPLLEVRGLAKSFGGVRAVDGVDLQLRRGEVLGLVGTNGAGKTTIFDLVSGFLVPDAGQVLLHGEDVTGWGPDLRALAGLGRSFQDARLFPELTVAETIAVALERSTQVRDPLAAALWLPAARDSEQEVRERVVELVEMLGLADYAGKFVGELSTGTRRVVDIACSLAHRPSVLLLDEPSSGVAQRETEELGPVLLDVVARTGASLLVVEHDMPLITGVADRLIALESGAVIAQGTCAEVLDHPRVLASYLGSDLATVERSGTRKRPARRRVSTPTT
jgi:ABC-type branched-subunit amino acid transport system ATPase component/predicted MFS family arabinose efflux permease